MGTTSSVNLGVANLLQQLTNAGSPLASSPTAVAALEKASPSDIVQLSAEASQLQGLDVLFGQTNTATTNQSAADSILSALYPNSSVTNSTTDPLESLDEAAANASAGATSTTGASSTTGSSSTASTPSLAQALASYQSNLQSDEIQSMFG